MRITDIIEKKKCGLPLSDEEIEYIIHAYMSGEAADLSYGSFCYGSMLPGNGGFRNGRAYDGHGCEAGTCWTCLLLETYLLTNTAPAELEIKQR